MKRLLLTIFISLTFIHLMYAVDGPNIWSTSLSGAGQIWAVAVNPLSQSTMYAGSNTTGIWKSTNSGMNWIQANNGLTNLTIQAIAVSRSNPQIVYCGTSQTGANAGVFVSTDAGANWSQINNGIVETSKGIQSIAIDPTNPNTAYVAVFDGVADSPQGLYKTTNQGANWNVANTGIGTIKNILTIIVNPLNPNVVFCGTSFGVVSQQGPTKIYRSNNAGESWTDASTGLPNLTTDNKPVRCLSMIALDTSFILAGLFMNTDSLSGVYVSTNGGSQWIRRHNGLPNAVGTLIRSCMVRPGRINELYVGLGNATNTGIGVYRSTNQGISWAEFNGGTLANTVSIRALNFRSTADSTVFAGGAHPTVASGQGVFEYSLFITGISNQSQINPHDYSLNQNFPNPFNPVTRINYSLGKPDNVTIKVFDITGKEITTIVNEYQTAGSYEVDFDGSGLSSGAYYYKMQSGNFYEVKSMILLK